MSRDRGSERACVSGLPPCPTIDVRRCGMALGKDDQYAKGSGMCRSWEPTRAGK